MVASVDELFVLRHQPECALEGKIWQPRAPVDLLQAGAEPRTFAGEITAAIARVIDEAIARRDAAEAQGEQVLNGLDRRGLRRGAPEAMRYSSTTGEIDTQVMPSWCPYSQYCQGPFSEVGCQKEPRVHSEG